MRHLTIRSSIYLATDLVLLFLCLAHIPSLLQRAQLPFSFADGREFVLVKEQLAPHGAGALQQGDQIESIAGFRVRNTPSIEFLADTHAIGDTVSVVYRREGVTATARVILGPAYTLSYIVIVCFVGIVTWCLGIFILFSRPRDLTASVLHWAMISMAVVVVIAFEDVTPGSVLLYVSSVLFFLSYAGIAVTFLLLTTLFPRRKFGPFPPKLAFIALPVCAVTGLMLWYHIQATWYHSAISFAQYRIWFDVFHVILLVFVGGGILNFVHSYLKAETGEERSKLKWVLWGLCIGPTPFLFLIVLPQVFQLSPFVGEEYTLIFLVIIPIAFAISFIRHHLLDVEVVINRTTVYGIVMALLLALYIGVVGIIANLAGSLTVGPSAVAAALVALLFEPLRARVQVFVDRQFFRVRYNFREAERKFVEQMKGCIGLQQLADLIVTETDRLIPVTLIGFILLREPGSRLTVIAHKNMTLLARHSVRFDASRLKTTLQLPIGVDGSIEPGIRHESADETVFGRWGMALVFPMLSENLGHLGFIVLGQKKSGRRFGIEDVDLLNNIATQAGLEVERIRLQEALLLEKAEAVRLDQLNRLKSDFVSYVSHELRTPLTSITMFTQLLRSKVREKHGKGQEYLDVIEGETGRLSRMVTTILDSARIEQGVQQYHMKDEDLCNITTHVMGMMKYQLDMHHFRVHWKPQRRPLPMKADADAVAQAIINLIANSIKYSGAKRELRVAVTRRRGWVMVRVADKGLGVSEKALPHLFERFYRDPSVTDRVQGVGLGLPLVKHIMEAHGGTVEVTSIPGRGSVFSLLFPEKGTNS